MRWRLDRVALRARLGALRARLPPQPVWAGLLTLLAGGSVAVWLMDVLPGQDPVIHRTALKYACEEWVRPRIQLEVLPDGRSFLTEFDLYNAGLAPTSFRKALQHIPCHSVELRLPDSYALLERLDASLPKDDARSRALDQGRWHSLGQVVWAGDHTAVANLRSSELQQFFGAVRARYDRQARVSGFGEYQIVFSFTDDRANAPWLVSADQLLPTTLWVMLPEPYQLVESQTIPRPRSFFPVANGQGQFGALYEFDVLLRPLAGDPAISTAFAASIQLTYESETLAAAKEYLLFIAAAMFGLGVGLLFEYALSRQKE